MYILRAHHASLPNSESSCFLCALSLWRLSGEFKGQENCDVIMVCTASYLVILKKNNLGGGRKRKKKNEKNFFCHICSPYVFIHIMTYVLVSI